MGLHRNPRTRDQPTATPHHSPAHPDPQNERLEGPHTQRGLWLHLELGVNFLGSAGPGRAPGPGEPLTDGGHPHSSKEDTPFPPKAQEAAAASRGGRHPEPRPAHLRGALSYRRSLEPGGPRPGAPRSAQEAAGDGEVQGFLRTLPCGPETRKERGSRAGTGWLGADRPRYTAASVPSVLSALTS